MPIKAENLQLQRKLIECLLLVLLIAVLGTKLAVAQDAVKPRRVLILSWSDSQVPAQIIVEQNLRSTLKSGSPIPLEIHSEYLDDVRTGSVRYEKEFVGLMRRKYEAQKFDVIFAINDAAIKFMMRNRLELFPDTPLLFLTLDKSTIDNLNLGQNVTGVWGEINYKANLELALMLRPGTKRVVVISGISEWESYWRAKAQEDFRTYEPALEFTYLNGLSSAELKKTLGDLPQNTIVIFISSEKDKAGNSYDNRELLSEISPGSTAPIYGASDAQLGFGIVGGRLFSLSALGHEVAQLGLRVMAGE